MRRITQFVALTVALLLASQSAMAQASCSMWLQSGSDGAQGCCAHAANSSGAQVGTDCHGSMPAQSVTSVCSQSGCQMAAVRVAAQAITTAKSKGAQALALVVIAQPSVQSPSISLPQVMALMTLELESTVGSQTINLVTGICECEAAGTLVRPFISGRSVFEGIES